MHQFVRDHISMFSTNYRNFLKCECYRHDFLGRLLKRNLITLLEFDGKNRKNITEKIKLSFLRRKETQ